LIGRLVVLDLFINEMVVKMGKRSWDDIPSLENASVDWDYVPESSFGKRSCERISRKHLNFLLDNNNVAVNISSGRFYSTGNLLDVSQAGLAVLLDDTELKKGSETKISLFLGTKKVISKAVVRNICSFEGLNRIGLEFVQPTEDNTLFIKGLVASQAYRH
jgi:hypothetical protein